MARTALDIPATNETLWRYSRRNPRYMSAARAKHVLKQRRKNSIESTIGAYAALASLALTIASQVL